MKQNRDRRIKETSAFLKMAGQSAIELMNEEAEQALHAVEWKNLEGVNLDAWFENTIRFPSKKNRRIGLQSAGKKLTFAASILLILLTITALVFATVEPARALLIRFVVDRFPQYSEYFIQGDDADVGSSESFSAPSYIPEEFQLDNSMDTDESRFMTWINEETGQSIMYSQTMGESSIMLDTEDAQIEQLTINGHNVEVIIKEPTTTVQFFSDRYCYALVTDLSYDDCMRIAESIPYLTQ